jgi:hypothetical protein
MTIFRFSFFEIGSTKAKQMLGFFVCGKRTGLHPRRIDGTPPVYSGLSVVDIYSATFSIIFPICVLDSIKRCASTTSFNANVL